METTTRRDEAVRMYQHGAGVDEIRDALGFKDSKAVRGVIRRALGSARQPKPKARVRRGDDEPLPVDILTSRDRRVHRFIAQRARRRERRLWELLEASGMTVVQMTTDRLASGSTWHLGQWDA